MEVTLNKESEEIDGLTIKGSTNHKNSDTKPDGSILEGDEA